MILRQLEPQTLRTPSVKQRCDGLKRLFVSKLLNYLAKLFWPDETEIKLFGINLSQPFGEREMVSMS